MSKKVTLYSQPGCGPCIETKNWLEDNEVEFEVVDIRQNTDGLHTILDKGFQGTPVVSVNNFENSWSGHDQDKLSTLIVDVINERTI